MGNFARAIECQTKVLDLSREHGIDEDVARALLHIAHVHVSQNDFHQAVTKLEEALPAATASGAEEIQLYILNSLGQCYIQLGDLQRAKHYFDAALGLAPTVNEPKAVIAVLINYGSFAIGTSENDTAIEMLTKAAEIAQDLNMQRSR